MGKEIIRKRNGVEGMVKEKNWKAGKQKDGKRTERKHD